MAFYEVTLRQRYNGQLCINVWSYFVVPGVGISPNSLELLSLMGFIPEGDPLAPPEGTIAALLLNRQNTSTEWLAVEARELYSVVDFYEGAYSPPLVGATASDSAMSPFDAYGFYSSRTRTDIRRAFKRFVGVSEGQVGAFGALVSGALEDMVELAEAMSAVLVGDFANYYPAVISRKRVVDEGTGRVTYELYPDEAEQAEHTAYGIVWAPYTTVRTQTSRTPGRGS